MRAEWCISAVMDRWRRRGSGKSGARAGAWRAGLAALATAALAVMLGVLFHLDAAAVAVGILGSLPTAYLAWAALPGATRKPSYGRPVRQWDPVELGVHQVIGGGPMPTYVRRPHDELLAAMLDPTVVASRLVVIRGGSSTGKTRAAYQAVVDRLADWQLDYPLDPGALAARLDDGIPDRTVLWLGELRQYADADGGPAVLGRLADLLEGEGHLVITAMWPEHWDTYIAAARAGPGAADPAGTAGRLLARLPELTSRDPAGIDPARGGVINVPDRFTTAEVTAAARTGDPLLAEAAMAATRAGQDGQLTQYLAGVPDLLNRYGGPGGDPYGQAIITSAMDATRLGHASALPAALLLEAAVGYLSGRQRTASIESWSDIALVWATAELKGAIRALEPVPPATGTGITGYQVADYLDQHGRRTRQDQLGPASLWDSLGTHAATVSDLTRLGKAARDRGLYRHAAAQWTTAATLGNADAVRQLITLLRQVSPADIARAARWAISHVSLDNLQAITSLLEALRRAGASNAVTALATRAASDASLDDPRAVAELLRELREARADDAVQALLARDPASHANLNDPRAAASLLRALREARADNAVTTLAARAASHVSLDNPRSAASLLRSLREAGTGNAVNTLAARTARAAILNNPRVVAELLEGLRAAGADDAIQTLLARGPASHAVLGNPRALVLLLRALREAGADDAVTTLAARAARAASLTDPEAVASLLRAMREAAADNAVTILAARAARAVNLSNPQAVAVLLDVLRAARADDAIQAVLARNPAGQANLDNPRAAASLLRALRAAGADDAVTILLARDPASQASLDNPRSAASLLRALARVS